MDKITVTIIDDYKELTSKKCLVTDDPTPEAAIDTYKGKFGVDPTSLFRWLWYYYMPVPEVEDLPLFKDRSG